MGCATILVAVLIVGGSGEDVNDLRCQWGNFLLCWEGMIFLGRLGGGCCWDGLLIGSVLSLLRLGGRFSFARGVVAGLFRHGCFLCVIKLDQGTIPYYYVREDVRCEWTVGSGCGKIGSSILQHEKNNHLHSIKLYGNGRTTHTDLAVDRRLPLWL